MNRYVFLPLALATLTSVADPVLSKVTVSQDLETRRVTISYNLSEEGIVTFDLQKDGRALSAVAVVGDVNKLVGAGDHAFCWCPDRDFGDVSALVANIVLTAWKKSAPPDYMTVNLLNWGIRYYSSTDALPEGGLSNDLYRTTTLLMRKVPSGGKTFVEGSPTTEQYRNADRETQRNVTFTEDYYIGVYEVTYKQFAYFGWRISASDHGAYNYKSNNRPENQDICPVNHINYNWLRDNGGTKKWPESSDIPDDCVLGALRKSSKIAFDLPTHAQWEFACRAGTTTATYVGDGDWWTKWNLIGWVWYPTKMPCPQEVGQKVPNDYGLYDMIGNVAEWCRDYAPKSKKAVDETDPKGASEEESFVSGGKSCRMVCGGSYGDSVVDYYRSAAISPKVPGDAAGYGDGFRLVCPCPVE